MKIITDKELHRFSISVYDFEDSLSFLAESLNHEQGSIAQEALLISAVIYFARPFSTNEREKNPKAIPNLKIDWFSQLTEAELELFGELIEMRNKCLAHAEYSKYPAGINRKTGVLSSRRYSISDSHINIPLFRSLLEKLIKQSHDKRADYSVPK